jgi:bla regulator protein BlaR1
MNTLEQVLPPALLRSIGFTLLHSLWQGTLIGVVAALLLMLLHRHAAVVRYRVAAGAVLALLLLAGLTFSRYYLAAPGGLSGDTAPQVVAAQVAENLTATASAPALLGGLVQAGSAYVETHLPLLVGAWLLGMVAMLLRFLGGLAYVQRLRHYRVAALPAAWQTWLDGLARRAGLTQRVQLLASALVPSPVVVGWLRPVVLLPLSVASGLPTPELEMILAHELAHVLRRDYLFNLLQSIAEILFFYHPAVWFLSASLRTERENCCDDVATRLHGDSRLLAQALAAVAELHYAATSRRPPLAVAALGPEGFGAAVVVMTGLVLLGGSTLASLGAVTTTSNAPLAQPAAPRATRRPLAKTVPAPLALPASPPPASNVLTPAADTSRMSRVASLAEVFDDKLLRDGLITSRQHADYRLTARELTVNGQRQPPAVADAYRRLYETAVGRKMGPGGAFGRNMDVPSSGGSSDALRVPASQASVAPPPAYPAEQNQNAQQPERIDQQAARQAAAQAALDQQAANRSQQAARQAQVQAAQDQREADRAAAAAPPGPLPEVQVQDLLRELRRAGLLATTESRVVLEFRGAGFTVNGRAQPPGVATHYRELLRVPVDAAGRVVGTEKFTLND